MMAAYCSAASSQTKWPASSTSSRLFGSRASKNPALATGTSGSRRPVMICTVGEYPGKAAGQQPELLGIAVHVPRGFGKAVAHVGLDVVGDDVGGWCGRAQRRHYPLDQRSRVLRPERPDARCYRSKAMRSIRSCKAPSTVSG